MAFTKEGGRGRGEEEEKIPEDQKSREQGSKEKNRRGEGKMRVEKKEERRGKKGNALFG